MLRKLFCYDRSMQNKKKIKIYYFNGKDIVQRIVCVCDEIIACLIFVRTHRVTLIGTTITFFDSCVSLRLSHMRGFLYSQRYWISSSSQIN